ncbi:dTDP-4-dehydrorhamnose reductase [candidate division KSB1 bacterium]
MSDLRILLTGCHGLLGQQVVRTMPGKVQILGADIDEKSLIHGDHFHYAQLDITRKSDVIQVCKEFDPDWIINTAAFTLVDECEIQKEQCWHLNVHGVEYLSFCARKHKAKLLHVSTDYIFDNTKEIYQESDPANPLNYYGKSKFASENAVRGCGAEWTIFRTSTLYGVDYLKARENFVTWVIGNLSSGKKIKIVTDQWGNPTLARNLAEAIWRAIMLNKYGIYNVAGSDIIDRYTFTKTISEIFRLDGSLISPITTESLNQKAPRPYKIGLDVTRAENELDFHLMGIKEALDIFKNEYTVLHRNN